MHRALKALATSVRPISASRVKTAAATALDNVKVQSCALYTGHRIECSIMSCAGRLPRSKISGRLSLINSMHEVGYDSHLSQGSRYHSAVFPRVVLDGCLRMFDGQTCLTIRVSSTPKSNEPPSFTKFRPKIRYSCIDTWTHKLLIMLLSVCK